MANDAYTQQALALDDRFRERVKAALSKVAFEVLDEDPTTPEHDGRARYANTVINNTAGVAMQVAPNLVMRPGVFAFETSYVFAALQVVSAAGDLDIEGQIRADWNHLAGIVVTAPAP